MRKLFAGVLVSLFVFVALPFSFLWGTTKSLASEEFYSENEFSYLLFDVLSENFSSNIPQVEKALIEKDSVEKLLADVFSTEDIVVFIDDIKEEFLTAEIDNEGMVEFTIPMYFIVLKSDVLKLRFAELFYSELPQCDNNVGDINFNALDDIDCIPLGLREGGVKAMLEDRFAIDILSEIKPEYAIKIQTSQLEGGSFQNYVQELISKVMFVFAMLMLLLLILIVLLLRDINALKWIFNGFLIAGVHIVVSILLLYYFAGIWLEESIYAGIFLYFMENIIRNILFVLIPVVLLSLIGQLFLRFRLKQSTNE